MVNTRILAARRSRLYILAAAILAVSVILLLHYLGRGQGTASSDECSGYNGQPSHLANGDPGELAKYCASRIPRISISIKNRHYIGLQQKRLESLPGLVLTTSKQDYVPAMIRFSDQVMKGKLRLKGDWVTHVAQGKSWSLRVRLAGDNHILGRRTFSLQLPEMRANDVDPLYTRMIRMLGIMTVDYQFVRVEFNGQDWGVMMLEDHFTRELMAAHRLTESVIGRLDESEMWRQRAASPDFSPYDNGYTSDYLSFNKRQILGNARLESLDRVAASLITAVQEGRLDFAQVVDQEKFLDFIILSEAWSAFHPMRWHNVRVYLNPYTLQFEPVPFDNSYAPESIEGNYAYSRNMPMFGELLRYDGVMDKLIERIGVVKETILGENNYRELADYHGYLESVLTSSGWESHVDLDVVVANLNYIADNPRDFFGQHRPLILFANSPKEREYQTFAKLSVYDNGHIAISNKMPFEIEVVDARQSQGLVSSVVAGMAPSSLPVTGQFRQARTQEFPLALQDPDNDFEVQLRNPHSGQKVIQSEEDRLIYLDRQGHTRLSPLLRSDEVAPDFVRVDGSKWIIPAGEWRSDRPIQVPTGHELVIEAGAHLVMEDGTYILSRGPLDILGTQEQPVSLRGEGGYWRGIYVVNAQRSSRWSHVSVADLEAFGWEHFTLTGALSFYRSPLEFDSVSISNVMAEDALNIIHGNFDITRLKIERSDSDAIDVDFGEGQISSSSFSSIGGDALDTSGSSWSGKDLDFTGIRDKAISLGEASDARLERLSITRAGVGVAVKDYSRATLEGASIADSELAAIMVYTKKPEYGGAVLHSSGVDTSADGGAFLCQTGSRLVVNGERVAPVSINTRGLYQTGVMKK